MWKTIIKYTAAVAVGLAAKEGTAEIQAVKDLAASDSGIKSFAGKAAPYVAGGLAGTAVGVTLHHVLKDADKVGVAGV